MAVEGRGKDLFANRLRLLDRLVGLPGARSLPVTPSNSTMIGCPPPRGRTTGVSLNLTDFNFISVRGATPFFDASSETHPAHPEAPRLMAMLATSVPCSQPLPLVPHAVPLGASAGRWNLIPLT